MNRRQLLIGCGSAAAMLAMPLRQLQAHERRDVRLRLPGGRQLGFRSYGDPTGTPILYFHGNPSCRIEAELMHWHCEERGIRLIAVDRPGIGLSSYSECHSIVRWPRDISSLVGFLEEESGIKSVGIVGNSNGVPFALACAAHMPDRVRAVGLVAPRTLDAPGVPYGVLDREILFLRRFPNIGAAILSRQIQGLEDGSATALSRQIKKLAVADQEFVRCKEDWLRRIVLEAARCGVEGLVQDISLAPWPWGICLTRIRVPVTIVAGKCDYTSPPETLMFLRRQLRHASINVIPNQGHISIMPWTAGALNWIQEQMI